MRRAVVVGSLVGVLQGLVALVLVGSLAGGPDDFGWFAYTPLQPGDVLAVPGAPTAQQRWLLVPLVLAVLGGVTAHLLTRGADHARGRGVSALGLLGLGLGVVTVALAPGEAGATTWVQLGGGAPGGMPSRYSDLAPLAEVSQVGTVVLLLVGSAAGAAVLVAVAGLADGRRWGLPATLVALGLAVVGLGVQLLHTGLAPITLLGEVLALGLVGAAAVVGGRLGTSRG